jgi:uncharacterized protein (TIGR02611 family)
MNWLLHHIKRVLRITTGFVLLLLGVIMMLPGIPGPGFLLILAGLGILAVDFVWAHRLRTHLKDRADKLMTKVRKQFGKNVPSEKSDAPNETRSRRFTCLWQRRR